MEAVYVLIMLVLVAAFVAGPLFRSSASDAGEDPLLAELQAAKEAKYQEIKDLELDAAAGKLDQAEYERQRTRLRREAADILRREREAAGEATGTEPTGRPLV